jgi:cytochrome c-type biogenesis protein CcmH/NrfG
MTKHKPSAKSSPPPAACARKGAVVLKRNAVALCVAMLLAGMLLGWQSAVMWFNQESAAKASGMGAQGGMPPGMPGAQGGMPPGMGGAQGNPMNSPIMAQAKTLEEQAAANPNDPKLWAKLGDLYYDAGLAERSVVNYQKSLALSPNQPNVWTDMGVMLREMKKNQEALKAFEQAAALDPKHEQSRFNIGIVYLDLNDKQSAAKAWNALLAVNPAAKTPDGKSLADAVKNLTK